MDRSKLRLAPLEESDWSAEQRELLTPIARNGRVFNVFKTLARHPKLMKRWLPFANHILFKSSLPQRDREMLILRLAWRARAEYEWAHHVEIGERAGLSDVEIQRITAGPDAPGWTPFEAALLRAVDELHGRSRLSDDTWNALAQRYDTPQVMDLIFTVGNYAALAMALNTFGVPLEEGYRGFPR
jgi:alkylhydroperoxidase family enzyme